MWACTPKRRLLLRLRPHSTHVQDPQTSAYNRVKPLEKEGAPRPYNKKPPKILGVPEWGEPRRGVGAASGWATGGLLVGGWMGFGMQESKMGVFWGLEDLGCFEGSGHTYVS